MYGAKKKNMKFTVMYIFNIFFYNRAFRIKYKLHRSSGSAPLPPVENSGCASWYEYGYDGEEEGAVRYGNRILFVQFFSVRMSRTQTLTNSGHSEVNKKKKKKSWRNFNFEKGAEFCLSKKKARWDEGDGGILLGDNAGSGTATARPSKFLCVRLPCPGTCSWQQAYSIQLLAQISTCAGTSGT